MAPCFSGAGVPTPAAGCTLETFDYADVDRDGDVDLRDAAAFQNVYADDYFDYGQYLQDKEAERVALTFAQGLTAPLELYEQAHLDLTTIRKEFPEYEDFVFRGGFPYDQLVVGLADGKGTDALQEFARYYQATIWCLRYDVCELTFCDQLNMEGMVDVAEKVPGVEYAHPNYYGEPLSCPSGSLWVEMPYYDLVYDFSCSDDTCCWRNLAFEMSESSEIKSITVSHPYGCEPDCP